jgi:hypothetical protein
VRGDHVGILAGTSENGLVHRRHRRIPRRPYLAHPSKELERVEARRAAGFPAGKKRGEERRDQSVNVKERHDDEAAIVGGQRERTGDVLRGRADVSLRQRHDLRSGRGARRMQHEGNIVRLRVAGGTTM